VPLVPFISLWLYRKAHFDITVGRKPLIFDRNCHISLGRTDGTVRARTALSLTRPYNTGYWVKYHVFARILALCRARIITIPTIRMGSLHYIAAMRMVGIVITQAQHSAKI
jgi:hypothetical protein